MTIKQARAMEALAWRDYRSTLAFNALIKFLGVAWEVLLLLAI